MEVEKLLLILHPNKQGEIMYQAIKWAIQHERYESFIDIKYDNPSGGYSFYSTKFPSLLFDTEEDAEAIILDIPSEAGFYKPLKLHLTAYEAL